MGKREASQTIAHKGYRDALAPRREPYWLKLGKGCYLGFRKTESGSQTWIARWTDRAAKHHYRALEPEGFETAKAKADEWFAQCRGGTIRAGTVEDVCKQYVADQRRERGADAADRSAGIFATAVYKHPIAKVRLDEITTPEIRAWRDQLVTDTRSPRGANRILTSFKAALNYGFREGVAPSDVAWRRVGKLKGEGAQERPRTVYISPEQRAALIDHCPPELANFLRGLLYTAARPGELFAAKVGDFDARHASLRLHTKKGRTGVARSREVPLDAAGVEFFKKLAKDKLPAARLVDFGEKFWRQDLSAALRGAVKRTNADRQRTCDVLPTDTVAYTMRHCAISDMLIAGIDVGTVSKIAGTSIIMITKYYFKFVRTDVAVKLATIKRF